MPARRPMTPEDLRRVVVVEELDLSADGQTAVIVRRSIQGNRYLGHLFAVDLGSDKPVPRPIQLTRGLIRDTRPRLCPDGHTLAFVRTDPTDDESVPAIGLLDLRAVLYRPASPRPDGGVRSVPRRVPRVCRRGSTRPPDRPDDPNARLVRALPALRSARLSANRTFRPRPTGPIPASRRLDMAVIIGR